ncbi:c-type cytochrome domain-containing protein [Schlesneria paludicola]|uniref:c-type cytochrome domain-containing protein n=1 Tax=Schlesneria paludicola TaxID=360056 RepID=UPI00029B28C1|nr:c-type cytochrome domain-containing protein [Schlesneria paludicola]
MQRFACRLAAVSLILFAMDGVFAQENLEQKIAEQQKVADESQARKAAGEPAINAARMAAKEKATAFSTLKLELNKAEASIKEIDGKLPKLQEAVKKASEERAKAETELAAFTKAALEAKGKDTEQAEADKVKTASEKLVATTKALDDALKAVQPIEVALAASKKIVAEQPAKIKAAEAAVAAFQPEIEAAEAAFAALTKEAVTRQIDLETSLVAAGRLVSFAKQVAPIFSERCLACHNARTAKGRLNMESFANLMKGGESGPSVVASNPGESLLQSMIEDHSMPKDADPLLPEQIAIIKKWIETGARLDAGVAATSTLITIMPKLVQPMPPESYRVAVPVMALAFSPDGTLLATSGYREVLLWNPADGQLVRRIKNLAERPHDLEFNADGTVLAVAAGTPGQMGEVKLFNVADGTLLADLFTTDDEVFSVAYSPDGTRLAAACADRSVRLFDVASRKQQKLIEDHADWVMDLAWSPDGKKIVTASRDKTCKVFDSVTGESQATFNGHGQPVFGVGFLPDGASVASSGRDNRIRVWNAADAKQAREIVLGGEVFHLTMQADGTAFSGCADKFARQHNLTSGAEVKKFGPQADWVYAAAYHAGSKRVASGSHDGEVRIWNYDDGKELLKFIAAPGITQPIAAK